MADLYIPLCEHCGGELPPRPSGRPGPRRHFCSAGCKQAAYRDRRQRTLEPALAFACELPPLPASVSTDELVAVTVLEAKGVAATLARLSLTARREFSWRCDRAAVEIKHTIDDYFPGV